MSYIVLTRFADLLDGNHIYEAGDTYPRLGLDVSPERLAELAGSDNRIGYPLIQPSTSLVETTEIKPKEVIAQAPERAVKGGRAAYRGRRKKANE